MSEEASIKAKCTYIIDDWYNRENEPTIHLKYSDGKTVETLLGMWAIRYSNENDYQKSDICIDLRHAVQCLLAQVEKNDKQLVI